ncbi:MAG: glucosamine-6-phosphate deaminase, partial [Prevotella sp.]|nr:glucosamine-6-phosphate deaminase [Prevotella sp.]
MRLNLSSQIVLNKIPEEFYKPKTAIERSEITRLEKLPTDIFPKVDEAVKSIVDVIEDEIRLKQRVGNYCVLGLGTGNSLTPVFNELIRRHKENNLSFNNVVVFNAYEYFPLSPTSQHSAINQLRERFLNFVDIEPQNVFSPDGTISQEDVQQHCRRFEQRIKTFGGIDVMLLGIGRIGNIATNEPGSGITSTSRIILIDPTSRGEMTMSFGTNEPVPPCSITMGISTILSSRKIFLTAWGEEKADIIRQTVEGTITDAIPASFHQTHNDAHVVIDLAAASRLTRIVHPWLVKSCNWTDKLVRSALVWLCQLTGKPILKLTNKDYNENGLSELLALYGSAYNANIKIFNDLQHTITGWPGGKPDADDTYRPERATPFPKRVLVFSPHPDDDVISMGGTIQRLVSQGHEVHIAYETSGNIAVGDEEVTRFMHFINGFNQLFGNSEDKVIIKKYEEIKAFLASKKEGDMDTHDILTIKGLIRRGEARTASTFS